MIQCECCGNRVHVERHPDGVDVVFQFPLDEQMMSFINEVYYSWKNSNGMGGEVMFERRVTMTEVQFERFGSFLRDKD